MTPGPAPATATTEKTADGRSPLGPGVPPASLASLAPTTGWPWGCDYWPGRIECGTLMTPPTSTCGSTWIMWPTDPGYCGGYVLPGLSQVPSPTSQRGLALFGADPIDLATGIFMLEQDGPDAARAVAPDPGARLPLGGSVPGPLRRRHDPQLRGDRRAHQQHRRHLHLRGHARTAFTQQPDGTFTTTAVAAFLGARITANGDGTYTLRHKDGATLRFDSQGRQIGRADRFGNALTITRTTTTTTAAITGPPGRARSLTWQGHPISQVTDSAGRTVLYGYDGNYRLTSVTDAGGGITQYAYDSADRLTTITDPRGILYLQNTYDANSRVCQQEQADGGVYTLYYVTADIATTTASLLLLRTGGGRRADLADALQRQRLEQSRGGDRARESPRRAHHVPLQHRRRAHRDDQRAWAR